MYLIYPFHAHWDLFIILLLKENIKRQIYRLKIIHNLAKDLCKNDISKIEPEQSKGHVPDKRFCGFLSGH